MTPQVQQELAREGLQDVPLLDREAIAKFLIDHKDRIRSVARRKLSASARTVFDSEDVFSSVLRRVDTMVEAGTLRPRSVAELWALIDAITRHNALNRTRLIERARAMLSEEGSYAQSLLDRLSRYSTDDEATFLLYRMMAGLSNETDRQVLSLHLRGATHRAIATLLSISEDASRQRWRTIRNVLQEKFSEGSLDG
jgi:DNA-directed RNA polymerase specialized sigma24 family protein